MLHFRAIRGAAPLKRECNCRHPKDAGHFRAIRGAAPLKRDRNCQIPPGSRDFRAIRGAAPLKHNAKHTNVMTGKITAPYVARPQARKSVVELTAQSLPHFRAIRGAAPLKPGNVHLFSFTDTDLFPRHSWRGPIEAAFSCSIM